MAATIGALRATLGIDTAQFESGLKRAQGSLGGLGGMAKMAGVAVAAGMATAAAGLAVAVKGAIDAADAMNDAAQQIGVPVAELSRLKYAAEQSGTSLDGLGTGIKKLSKNMADVAAGGGKAASVAFDRLGIAVRNSDGTLRDSSEVLSDVAARFGDMQDGAGKTATAMALFGKSGADLIPMLNEGRDGLEALKDEADALGVVIDEKTARAADAFNDNLGRLKMAGQGMATQITAQLLPTMLNLSGVFVSAAKDASFTASTSQILGGALKGLAIGAVVAGGTLKAVVDTVAMLGKAMGALASGNFAEAGKAWSNWDAQMTKTVQGSKAMIASILTGDKALAARPRLPSRASPTFADASESSKAAKATKKVNDDLADDLERINDRLLSGRERFDKEQAESMAKLQEGLAKSKISAAQFADQMERLEMARIGEFGLAKDPFKKFDKLNDNVAGLGDLEDFQKGLAEREEDVREMWDNAVGDGVRAALDGDLQGFLSHWWKEAAANAMTPLISDLAQTLAGSLSKVGGAFGSTIDSLSKMVPQLAAISELGGMIGSTFAKITGGNSKNATLGGKLFGGIGGIIGSFFGKSDKKAAKEAEALKKAEEELAAARDAARDAADRMKATEAERSGLQIRLLELSGDKVGALAAKRQQELAALDASNRGLAEQAHQWEDYNEAVTVAAANVDAARSALSAAYEREASGIETTITAIEAAGDALQGVRDKFAGFLQSLSAYRSSLGASAAAIRSPGELLRVMSAAFKAANDDVAAGNDRGFEALQGVSEQYLEAGQGAARTQLDVLRQMAQVRNAVKAAEAIAGDQVAGIDQQLEVNRLQLSAAQSQLGALKALVDAALGTNSSVMTVADAISQLGAALGAQIALKANPPTGAATGGAAAGSDWGAAGLAAGITAARGAHALSDWMRSEMLFLQEYTNFAAAGATLRDGDRFWQVPLGSMADVAAGYGLPAFANGGGFTVGGAGGIDSQVRAMRLSPGERVDVSTPGQMNDNAQQLRGLRDDIGMLTRRVEAVAIHTASTAADSRLNRKDGLPVRAQDPTQPITVRVA